VQLLGLDHFPANITEFDVHQFFTYSDDERRAIMARHGSRSRAGFAIQLGFMRMTGRPLSSLDAVPSALLKHLQQHLAIETPDLATLRTLYQHPRTLFHQQQAARKVLRFRELSRGRQGALSRYLQGESKTTRDTNRLLSLGRQWLYDMRSILPGDRRMRQIVRNARTRVEKEIADAIAEAVSASTRRRWFKSVMKKHSSGPRTVLEWLRLPPKRRLTKDLRLQLDKLEHLKSMGVHRVKLDGIEVRTQQTYAAEVRRRRPSRLNVLQEPRRTIALVCFLNVRMYELMDEVIALSAMNGRRIVRKASDRVRSNDARSVGPLLEAIEGIRLALQDETLAAEKRVERAIVLLPTTTKTPSFAARLRAELSTNARRTRPMLRRLVKLELSETDVGTVTKAMKHLERLYEQGATSLPPGVEADFAPRWKDLIEGEDRRQALRAYECAVLQELRQRLRSGAVWADKSIEHRAGHEIFITEGEWKRSRDRHYRQLALSDKPDAHLDALDDALATGLQALDEAVTSGEIPIKDRRVCIDKLDKEPVPDELDIQRRQLVQAVGSIQLPELLVEMDGHVRFSWAILGRPPRSKDELLAVYGAILASGTELDAAGISLMIPGLTADTIASFMHLLDEAKVVRQANAIVIEFMRQHAIVEKWGDGSMMSSDAMSLEATRHLWRARVDPKHRRYAIGMYTHLGAQDQRNRILRFAPTTGGVGGRRGPRAPSDGDVATPGSANHDPVRAPRSGGRRPSNRRTRYGEASAKPPEIRGLAPDRGPTAKSCSVGPGTPTSYMPWSTSGGPVVRSSRREAESLRTGCLTG
jgi:hypothetical protein